MIWPFNKDRKSPTRPLGPSARLEFKSGKDALDHIAKWMKTNLAEHELVNGVIAEPRWRQEFLIAPVLVPVGDAFQQVYTMTAIKAYETPTSGRVPVSPATTVGALGLQTGDLVSVLIVKHAPELAPDTEWLGAIMFKLDPVYDMKIGSWQIARKYEF